MYKITKQSLIDYEVTVDGKHYAWITKQKDGSYSVTIKEFQTEYKGFRYLRDAKEFIING